ncbi:hypothetical protein KBC85_03105 [Candidatus Saccharibacteria bacterium]|nr:hypothetical protein [Candidatus Saccharibacteria bacterium]MDQ5885490.1 hypothetical protein [Patescibacteria group bacterium]MDQ5953511.1 hypothetical protein [Patescibacteria group bacterium]MDQ5958356.1 hypothetical protein [Patescibacteria group bacterium]
MRFFGAFMLLVLPLFLLVCIQMIKNSSFSDALFAKILIVIFYINIVLALGTALYLVTLL